MECFYSASRRAGNNDEIHYEKHFVTRYFAFDKVTEKSEIVLTLGLPKGNTSYKVGCFGKQVTAEVIYEEAPIERKQVAKPLIEGFAGGKMPQKKAPVRKAEKVGRNDPCPCGSGKKYKKCCALKENS